jgi:hypothetical protein
LGIERADFLIPALFVTACSALVGGIFTLLAWIAFACDPDNKRRWRIPLAIYTLAASSFLDWIGYFLLPSVPSVSVASLDRLWSFVLVSGFVFVLVSLFLAIRYSGPARGTLLVGSVVLFLVNALGYIVFLYLRSNGP